MGQTQPQKPTGPGQDWALVGSVGGDLQLGGRRRLCSQGSRQSVSGSVWLSQGGLGSCPLQARSGVVGSARPLAGAGRSSIPGAPSGRGSSLPALPRKKGSAGSMPGSCAGDGGCSGGRQRLPIGLARAKAGRQRLGRRTLPFPLGEGGGSGPSRGLAPFSPQPGEGGGAAFQKPSK
jgi:hypothetical protein